ncbi:MAG: hypothetical protein LBE35_00565 [Clostridiales bacterium]|jgi:hypothetical protein|nr:hypothetical protein [Clostridiales bacterium]
MYRKIDPPIRMNIHEASEHYPDEYILMQRDNRDLFLPEGLVLYVGDDVAELYRIQFGNDIPLGIVTEGRNLRRSLGGIVVGT